MQTTLNLSCTFSNDRRTLFVSKADYACRIFPNNCPRTARRKLLQAIMLDPCLLRALQRVGWKKASRFFTLREVRLLKRHGL